MPVLQALVGIWVISRHHYDVAVVDHSHVLALSRGSPREERLRTHIVIYDRPAEAPGEQVRQGAMKKITVEYDGGTGSDLHGDGVLIAIRELICLGGAIEAGIVDHSFRVDDTCPMGTGQHPQATVPHGRVIESDPHARQGAVACRYEVLVLVPGLARLAFGLYEQHRLHGLDIGADYPGQPLDRAGMRKQVEKDGRNLVREMYAEKPPEDVPVRLSVAIITMTIGPHQFAAANPDALSSQGRKFAFAEEVFDDQEPVSAVPAQFRPCQFRRCQFRLGVRTWSGGRRG